MRNYLLVLSTLALFACQSMDPKEFGMSEAEWQRLTPEQKKEYSDKYWSVKKQHAFSISKRYNTPYSRINVRLSHGSALLWPAKSYQKYMPIELTLKVGQCQNVTLSSYSLANKTTTDLCYNGKELELDSSHWQSEYAAGGLKIPRHHLWQQGMSYEDLTSKGYAQLKNVKVFIRAS